MVTRDMHPMTQVAITNLNKTLQEAQLNEMSSLVIVDNSSAEPLRHQTLASAVPFRVVRLDRRHSFSSASNWGAKKLKGADFLLFLNNDVFLHPYALKYMLEDTKLFSASICGARLVYPNQQIQHVGVGFKVGGEPFHLHHYENSRQISRVISPLPAVTGAVMLIDSDLFWALNGFDPRFPFAYEDTDFCLRAGATGAKIICSQRVESIHLSGQTRDHETRKFEKLSRDIFMARWRGRVGPILA